MRGGEGSASDPVLVRWPDAARRWISRGSLQSAWREQGATTRDMEAPIRVASRSDDAIVDLSECVLSRDFRGASARAEGGSPPQIFSVLFQEESATTR
jgi:hypothetical protein